MGVAKANVEVVTDYSTQEGCVRLHIDLPLSAGQMDQLRKFMDAGNYAEAFALARKGTTSSNHQLVDAFEQAFAVIVRARPLAA